MNKEARKALRLAILDKLEDDMMPMEVGGHTITDQYVYAGCSQWCQEGREWDDTNHGMAYIVDGKYQLTFPKLDFFNGHNNIDRQTAYYLQPDRAENPPTGPVGEPLQEVPDAILLDIGNGLVEALKKHEEVQNEQDKKAIELAAKLSSE